MSFDENELSHIKEWTDRSQYIISHYGKIQHAGLGRSLLLKDFDHNNLQNRIKEQVTTWAAVWKLEQYKRDTEPNATYSHELADQMTAFFKSNLRVIKDMLAESLSTDIRLDWEELKDLSVFPIPNPEAALLAEIDQIPLPVEPLFKELPKDVNEEGFTPQLGFFDRLFAARGRRKKEEAQTNYNNAIALWEAEVDKVETENMALRNDYLLKLAEAESLKKTLTEHCEQQVNEWHRQYKEFTDKKSKQNQAIDQWKADYLAGNEEAVVMYFDYILHYSAYPDLVSKQFILSFQGDQNMLVVDYLLPAPQKFPRVSEVRYIPPRGLLKDYDMSDRQFSRIYNDAIYKMALRTVYEVINSDVSGNIEQIVYNGWVGSDQGEQIDQRCILSLQVSKEDFTALNLQYTDPQICFQELKGRANEDLVLLKAVEPFVETDSTRWPNG